MRVSVWIRHVGAGIGARWREVRAAFRPRWRTAFVESDVLPSVLPQRRLVVAREDGELWSAGMNCPCGCGEIIELGLFPEAEQSWTLEMDGHRRPTLLPSVWRRTGCRSHFWMRRGRIYWC